MRCSRHCKTLEGFGGQVWPKINRKPTQRFPCLALSVYTFTCLRISHFITFVSFFCFSAFDFIVIFDLSFSLSLYLSIYFSFCLALCPSHSLSLSRSFSSLTFLCFSFVLPLSIVVGSGFLFRFYPHNSKTCKGARVETNDKRAEAAPLSTHCALRKHVTVHGWRQTSSEPRPRR